MLDPLDRKISRGFGLATFVLSAILVTSLWLNAKRRDCNLAVTHTHNVLINIEHTRLGIARAETQLRGYLLTGQPEYLEAYATAATDTKRYLAQLGELTTNDPDQQHNLDQANAQLNQLDAYRKKAIRSYPQTALLRDSVLSDRVQTYNEGMERSLNAIERDETIILHQHIEHWKNEALYSGLVSMVLTTALFGLLWILYKIARCDMALRRANVTLLYEATTDGLTGLKNRRAFEKQLNAEFQRAARHDRSLSCLLLDVDCFKQFNDTYGHPAGDQALQQVAAIIQANARLSDYAARYGGEEFALLLPETDIIGAMEVAVRLREAIASHPWSQQPITVSIGAASLQSGGESAAVLMQQVDQALYAAKAAGRNRVEIFLPSPTPSLTLTNVVS